MKHLILVLLSFTLQVAGAKTFYGVCYGTQDCSTLRGSGLVTKDGCRTLLAQRNYEVGSWSPYKSKSCVVIPVLAVAPHAFPPLPAPAGPSTSPGVHGVATPPSDFCRKHPQDASNCGGGHQNITCGNGTLAQYCPASGYTCDSVCP